MMVLPKPKFVTLESESTQGTFRTSSNASTRPIIRGQVKIAAAGWDWQSDAGSYNLIKAISPSKVSPPRARFFEFSFRSLTRETSYVGILTIESQIERRKRPHEEASLHSVPENFLSGDNHGRGRDRPNRDPYATDARLHPTICDSRSSSAPALHAGCDAISLPPRSGSRGARWLRADCGRLWRRVAGSRRQRAELERLQI